MKAFRFSLERALHWRGIQCELEEAKSTRLGTERVALAQQLVNIATARKSAAESILSSAEILSAEFQTLATYNNWTEQQKVRIAQKARQLDQQIAEQALRTAEARRKKKLLEKLREGRLQKWTALRDSEDEQVAADSWLSRYVAERYTTDHASP
jgi:hypothetical protein